MKNRLMTNLRISHKIIGILSTNLYRYNQWSQLFYKFNASELIKMLWMIKLDNPLKNMFSSLIFRWNCVRQWWEKPQIKWHYSCQVNVFVSIPQKIPHFVVFYFHNVYQFHKFSIIILRYTKLKFENSSFNVYE